MFFWKKKKPIPIKPRWGFSRRRELETGAVIRWSEGRARHMPHIKLYRIILRSSRAGTVSEISPAVRECLCFILESERRAAKALAAEKLFCTCPNFGVEVVAFDTVGRRLELLVCGFCIVEDWVDKRILAIDMMEFLESQILDANWELTGFLDRESNGSRLLLMTGLLSSYFYGIHGSNR